MQFSVIRLEDRVIDHSRLTDHVESTGLVLSPAFDINPNPHKNHLSLAIDETDTSLNLDGARAAGTMYGLKRNRLPK